MLADNSYQNINKFLNKITLGDCLDVLKQLPDKCIDLILTDPPYGEKISRRGVLGTSNIAAAGEYEKSNWDDSVPTQEIFNEMFRISKHQIIFGGNFMVEQINKNSSCWIVWDKDNTGNYADCELAWTSFPGAIRKITWRWNGMLQQDMKNKEIRVHPTQKPVGLFKAILREYYKKNQMNGIVLDCFGGSGTTAIACDDLGIPFIVVEKDENYFKKSCKRLNDSQAQMKLFKL